VDKKISVTVKDGPSCACGCKNFVVASRLQNPGSVMLECEQCDTYRLATESERKEIEIKDR